MEKIISLGDPWNPESDETTVDEIIEKYKNHPRISAVKDSFLPGKLFDLPKSYAEDN